MGKYTTDPLRTGREIEKSDGLGTLGGDGSYKEALTTRRRLQGCVAKTSRHGRRNSISVYMAGKEDAASTFAEIAAANKYPSKVAYRAALVEALKVGDAIVVDGVIRELKPTAADGRIAG